MVKEMREIIVIQRSKRLAKLNKPILKTNILYDLTYMWNLKKNKIKQTNNNNRKKKNFTETENR